MPELASVNGVITPIDQATISINDRGLVFGDAVYEVVVSYKNKLFLFDQHLARLRRSLNEVGMHYVDLPPIIDQINAAVAAAEMPRCKVYLQVSRGQAPRDHAFPDPPVPPNVIVTIREFPVVDEKYFQHGIACMSLPDIRWGRVDIKTVNLLPNCLAKQQAMDAGFMDALLIGPDQIVREATAANAFIVRGNAVWTHPADQRILPGITRWSLLELARDAGLEVFEQACNLEETLAADEVFLSGTTAEVMPVVRIDDRTIGDGTPGPVSRQLLKLFRAWIARKNGE